MIKILFVCLGNICRSPTAQGVFEGRLAARFDSSIFETVNLNDAFLIDSAGTAAWHIGKQADTRSQLAAKERGYDLSNLHARQVSDKDFAKFDYILAMDKANLESLQESCPRAYLNKLALFLDFAEGSEQEVPDPYYGGGSGFNQVLDLIESASDGLIAHLIKKSKR
ncbi:MAG: protein-tyrosine phosphatase [Oleiphilaceae bacterium]|jgi:protein-tyrosine phosphatase